MTAYADFDSLVVDSSLSLDYMHKFLPFCGTEYIRISKTAFKQLLRHAVLCRRKERTRQSRRIDESIALDYTYHQCS